MRFSLLLLAILMSCLGAGCSDFPRKVGPGGFGQANTELDLASLETSGLILVAFDGCDIVSGSVEHLWNSTRYNPLVILHLVSKTEVRKVFWGLEFDGAKDLTGPGSVDIGNGDFGFETPPLFPGPSFKNFANFSLDGSHGRLIVMWHDVTGGVKMNLTSDCNRPFEVKQSDRATGFRIGDLEEGVHLTGAGASVVADGWESPWPGSTLLMIRYYYSDAGTGELRVESSNGNIQRSLNGSPETNCLACMKDGRFMVIDAEPVHLAVTYAGNGRQTLVYGLAVELPGETDGQMLYDFPGQR